MGSQQLFCLRWSNHQTNMLSVFDQLLQSEALVDVTLACEGLSFRAHKVVLSACSPYFQSLFMENPCKHPIVILKDIKYSDLRALVDFMYKGEVNVTQEQLSALLKTAETLKVKGLAEMTSSNNVNNSSNNNNNNNSSSNNSSVTGDNMSPSSSLLATMPLTNAHHHHHHQHNVRQQRTGSPLAKRKKIRHHTSTSTTTATSAVAATTSYSSRPPSLSRDASLDGDDDHSLEIQGSPEVIETKVEVPSDGFIPERAADQDSQMLDHEFRTSNEIKAEGVETKPSLAFHNTTTTTGTTTALSKSSVGSGGGDAGHPTSAPSSPPLACSLTPATPASCSSSTLPPSLPSTSGTQPATGQAQSRSAPDSQDDDSLDTPPPLHTNSSSLIEAIGAQMFGRYAPLTILPITQSMGSSLIRHEPASPSSNSSGTNPKRGQPRILNEEEENLIVHYIMEMAALGKPVTRKCVLEYGNMLLRRQDRVPTGSIHCNPEKGLSNDWWKEFKKRHPGLPFRLPVTPNS